MDAKVLSSEGNELRSVSLDDAVFARRGERGCDLSRDPKRACQFACRNRGYEDAGACEVFRP